MPVICLEGALAVGKTTTARALSERLGAFVVPEMNRLFHPGDPDAADRRSFGAYVAEQPPDWYLLRQVDRWQMARDASPAHALAVLDRDPFQPLWHRWAFGYEGGGPTLGDLIAFYRPRIEEGSLGFPDAYYLLTAPIEEIVRRKENDRTRDRRGFEGQRRFFEPQKAYFSAMKGFDEGRVHVLSATTVEDSVARIQGLLPGSETRSGRDGDLALIDAMGEWLSQTAP